MKLRQSPHKSPVGVKFKVSDEHSSPFRMGAHSRVSKCLTGSEGVNECWSDGVKSAHHYNLENNKDFPFFKLKLKLGHAQ